MDCRETEKLLSLYLDGEFSDSEKIEIDEHLSGCHRCQAILEEERTLKEAIRSIRLKRTPPDLRAAIERSIVGERRSIAFHNVLKFAAGFGVVALAVVSTVVITRSMTPVRRVESSTCVATNEPRPVMFHKSKKMDGATTFRGAPVAPVALSDTRSVPRAAKRSRPGRVRSKRYATGHSARLSPRMMENLVADYLRPLPVEFKGKDPNSAAKWYGGKTGLYAPPPHFASWGGKMVGGRMSRFNGGDAVQLLYSVNGRRVTLFMFNPKMMPGITTIKDRAQLKSGAGDFVMETPGGRIVALFAHKGIGYSIISDQDKKTMLALVRTIIRK